MDSPAAIVFEEAVEERVPGVLGIHPDIKGISHHGWRRWCERAFDRHDIAKVARGGAPHLAKVREWSWKVERLKRALSRAVEVQLKPRYRVAALCNNGFEPARYFRSSWFVFVVSVRTGLVMTVHTGEARRWESIKED